MKLILLNLMFALFTLTLPLSLKGEGVGNTNELIENGDRLFATRTPTSGAAQALEFYEKAITTNTASSEAHWKAARACHWLADHSTVKREKIILFEKGMTFAKKAAELDPKNIESHFWLAALYGSYGESKGVLKSLALVKPIRQELETVNRINDRYQGGAGYRIMGIVDYKVPGFAGGSKKRAKEQINKALSIDPTNAFNQYYAAEFYGTVLGDKKQAGAHLERLAGLTVTDDVDSPNLKMMQEKGEKLKAQIGT